MFFFQMPWLPEALASQASYALLTRTMRSTARPGTFSDEDFERYRTAWSQPGALTAMLNWYRAALPMMLSRTRSDGHVEIRALLIWGAQDAFLGRELVEPTIWLCRKGRVEFLEEATHWLTHEEPEKVHALLTNFLSGSQEMRA
jgi:pimeloyl-ACP methyl ester carboxylesterase